MFNYIMLVMYAVEQERDREHKIKHGTKTQDQIAKERIGDLKMLLGDDSPIEKEQGMITIEVTPEDMKKAKEEKAIREKAIRERRLKGISNKNKQQRGKLPPGRKPPSSSGK